jgi:hypothetical protein
MKMFRHIFIFSYNKSYSIWTHLICENLLFMAEVIASFMQSAVIHLVIQIWVQAGYQELFVIILLTCCPNSF